MIAILKRVEQRAKSLRRWLTATTALLLLVGVLAAVESDSEPDEFRARSPEVRTRAPEASADAEISATSEPSLSQDVLIPGAVGEPGAQRGSGAPTSSGGIRAEGGARAERIPAGAGAHGVTDDTIEIGLFTIDLAAAVAARSALEGVDRGGENANADLQKGAQAVVDHLNARGGMAGRRVVPVYHNVDVSNTATPSGRDREKQNSCARWTEDHRVFAMQGWTAVSSYDCALSTTTPVIADLITAQEPMSASRFARYGDVWYSPNGVLADRRDSALVEVLSQQGFFGSGAKVGLVVEDLPGPRESVRDALIPALVARGIKPVIQIEYPDAVQSPWETYVLQLQSAGVTHVLFSTSELRYWAPAFVMRAAEDQGYRPRWGIASDLEPASMSDLAPPSQLANAQGMGWLPLADMRVESESSSAEECDKVIRDSGQEGAALYCEVLFFLKFVLDRASEVSVEGFREALASVADQYPSMHTIGGTTNLGPARHDGAALFRDLRYDPRCGQGDEIACFRHTSPPKPIP